METKKNNYQEVQMVLGMGGRERGGLAGRNGQSGLAS